MVKLSTRTGSRLAGTRLGWPVAVAFAASGLGGATAPTAAQTVAAQPTNSLALSIGRGRLVTLSRPMSDLFVADDKIADVQVRSPTQLYIFGKTAGETSIYATAKGGGVIYATSVRVGSNIDSVQQMLGLAMPDAKIVATPMNGLVLLTGTVAAPDDAAEAERLTQAYVGDAVKVLSRLKTATPLQVNLQVKIAEVSRNFAKNIGVNFQNQASGPANKPIFGFNQGRQGTITNTTNPNGSTTTNYEFPANAGFGTALGIAGKLFGADILSSLDLGERNGQVTTLANPNLTAISGETGSFLAGGEIPIPISQGLGAVSVEYKQYGISLSYTPTVLADGRISLRVRPEVSQLTSAGAVQINGTTIPALTTRRAETTVELGSGQSLMIGGLIQNTHNNSIDSTPGLGDLPVLGALFHSNSWQRGETELMIVITPYLVKPVNANEIVLPTDGYQAPTDLERVFLGKLGGGKTGGDRAKPSVATAPGDPNPAGTPIGQPDAIEEKAVQPPAPPRLDAKGKNEGKGRDKGNSNAAPAPGFNLN
ncbi:MAG: type II and III secretion system protein family protein [Sphingomonas sp.]|jgi:pilus assembly protein CpaC